MVNGHTPSNKEIVKVTEPSPEYPVTPCIQLGPNYICNVKGFWEYRVKMKMEGRFIYITMKKTAMHMSKGTKYCLTPPTLEKFLTTNNVYLLLLYH